jgi:hypothetical protein
MQFPSRVLNSVNSSGLKLHPYSLKLNKGATVLLRILNVKSGLQKGKTLTVYKSNKKS